MMSIKDYLEQILMARVYDAAIETPLQTMPILSKRVGNTVRLKREDLQPVFSYKIRGAFNKMVHLTPAQRQAGVVAASAGNHAQGVALSAQILGCKAIIVMPESAPHIKVDAVRSRGAEVRLYGTNFDEALAYSRQLESMLGLTFISPYDDPLVIAGQGTVGMELLRQDPDLQAIFIPVGGGGLIAGVGAYIKALKPEIKIIGVEPVDADAMWQSLQTNTRVQLARVGMFADGVAVKQVGVENLRLCQMCVDDIVLVDTDAMCAAMKDVFDDTRAVLEPAGALAVAGAKAWLAQHHIKDWRVAVIGSGANINFNRLQFVAERTAIGEAREAILAVTIPERQGSFKAFCRWLGARNITEFNYRYSHQDTANIFVGITIAYQQETAELIGRLQQDGFNTLDLTHDELAKTHLRHLVGGKSVAIQDERLLRFEFPECPGALMAFLEALTDRWNISLFHYRNHGSDNARVLVGVQVPDQDVAVFHQHLDAMDVPWLDETHNPGYQLFLR